MKTRHITSLLGVLALALGLRAGAATISLQGPAAPVLQSNTFTVKLLVSALDAPGGHPASISGQVVIDLDPTKISYNNLALASGVSFWSGTGVAIGSLAGRQTLTFGFNGAPDSGTAATLSFAAIGAPSTTTTIGMTDFDGLFGTFVNTVPTNQSFNPTMTGTSLQISAVPLPATAWLLLTAFGAVATRLRRVSRAARRSR